MNNNIEIERKFLPKNSEWIDSVQSHSILTQGYFAREDGNSVRIRIEDNGSQKKAILCLKGSFSKNGTPEFEYEVTLREGADLLKLCDDRIIKKKRHMITTDHHTFEIDEFQGSLQGLLLIEVELTVSDQQLFLPDWVGTEVTNDMRYSNTNLVTAGMPK